MNAPTINKPRRVVGLIMISLGGLLLIFSSGLKFTHVPKPTSELASLGFSGGRVNAIACLEILSAALLLVPRTRALGLLMASAYLGGAIATHLQHDQPFFAPCIILAIIWTGVLLRHPESFWSSKGSASWKARTQN